MAISRPISSIYLGAALRLLLHQRLFVTAATPPRRTHGAAPLTGLLQLDGVFSLMEPCWISVVVHSPVPHPSGTSHSVSRSDVSADMFHLGTDVDLKEVQMEISAFRIQLIDVCE